MENHDLNYMLSDQFEKDLRNCAVDLPDVRILNAYEDMKKGLTVDGELKNKVIFQRMTPRGCQECGYNPGAPVKNYFDRACSKEGNCPYLADSKQKQHEERVNRDNMYMAKELSDQAGARVDDFLAQQRENNYDACQNFMQQNARVGSYF